MAFIPFTEEDRPTMAAFNEKFQQAIAAASEDAVNKSAKLVTGSYVGTGTFGSSNPNSITFEKGIPYLVIITTSESASGQIIGLFIPKTLPNSYVKGSYRMLSDNSVTSSDMYSKVDGNTLYWYSTAMNWQLNTKDTYDYYAFY